MASVACPEFRLRLPLDWGRRYAGLRKPKKGKTACTKPPLPAGSALGEVNAGTSATTKTQIILDIIYLS